jgi:hypothetical protein
MEQTAVSGLYREEQLEIGVQAARKLRPDLSDDALLELAKPESSKNVTSLLYFSQQKGKIVVTV